jgi:hypothetical protein
VTLFTLGFRLFLIQLQINKQKNHVAFLHTSGAAPKCGCRRERRQGRNLGEASPSRYSPFVPGILASKYGCFQLTSDWVGGNVSTKAWLQSLEEGELRIYK